MCPRALLLSVAVGAALVAAPAHAQPPGPGPPPAASSPPSPAAASAELLPTFTPTGEMPSTLPLRSPGPSDGVLVLKARELDGLLGDTAQDLGLSVTLTSREDMPPSEAAESRLLERSKRSDQWLISPRLEIAGGDFIIRLVVVPPRSNLALVRVERVRPQDFAVRAAIMLRDLVRAGQGQSQIAAAAPAEGLGPAAERPERARSDGRATLAVNAAILGGFVGYALQKSSGSNDARLTYPLLALGAGIGVGGSLIVAEEWDVRIGDAWYLSAGAVWPTVGGLLVARGREVMPESDRWAYGIAGGLGGITLASVALSFGHLSDAGAAFAHSGGALGMGLGGGTELAIRGSTKNTPYEGMGYGAIGGVVAGGLIATQIKGSASRVFMVDVGAGLGALAAAAAASPLVFGERTDARDRIWIATTMAGAFAGGAVAYLWTGSSSKSASASQWPRYARPMAGVIGVSQAQDGSQVPAYGIGCSGLW